MLIGRAVLGDIVQSCLPLDENVGWNPNKLSLLTFCITLHLQMKNQTLNENCVFFVLMKNKLKKMHPKEWQH